MEPFPSRWLKRHQKNSRSHDLAATARAAFASHSNYRHSAADMLRRINGHAMANQYWGSIAGDAVHQLDPETEQEN